ncbi:hypothetical protein DPMN_151686 [Dreissena polymorpha]|uniref:Uncharacterized protein n=1 Tax=Dreissena polymorpha TaxID=45954 RepID=A0A9D4J369_DREPO|nr:hypothetical protein DPMN_151686 [Dreissena polymorpha]
MAKVYSRNSERPVPRYHPEHLAALVGDENTEHPDDVIKAMINIMKVYAEPEDAKYIGYYTPAQIIYICSQIQPHITPLPEDRDILNIHNLGRHWVTTFYSAECRTVFVCDSLKHNLTLSKLKSK